jgi:hypothetical protein
MYLEMFFVFLGLHALADYPLQGEFLATFKGKNNIAMVAHCAIWTQFIYAGLKYYGLAQSVHLPFLFFGHMYIDEWKCKRAGNGKELTTDLMIDQLAHFAQILVCIIIN